MRSTSGKLHWELWGIGDFYTALKDIYLWIEAQFGSEEADELMCRCCRNMEDVNPSYGIRLTFVVVHQMRKFYLFLVCSYSSFMSSRLCHCISFLYSPDYDLSSHLDICETLI